MTTGGLVFQVGKRSERLGLTRFKKVEAQEKKDIFNNEKICEIYNKINILQNDVSKTLKKILMI